MITPAAKTPPLVRESLVRESRLPLVRESRLAPTPERLVRERLARESLFAPTPAGILSRATCLIAASMVAALLASRAPAHAEPPGDPPPSAGEQEPQAQHKHPGRAELEKEFGATLANATLQGTWQMTGKDGLSGRAPLTDPRPESYTISRAVKLTGDHWLITARIRFGETDVTLPVPVRVLWAGDTPIITVDSWTLPGMGSYSARVMIFGGFYTGVWFSTEKDYGGTLSGRVLRDPQPEPQP